MTRNTTTKYWGNLNSFTAKRIQFRFHLYYSNISRKRRKWFGYCNLDNQDLSYFRDGHISLFNLRYGKLAIVSLFYYISKAKNQPCRRTYSSVKQINKNSDYFRFNLQLTIRNNLKFNVASSSPCMRNDQRGPHLQNFSKTFSISTPKESLATNRP